MISLFCRLSGPQFVEQEIPPAVACYLATLLIPDESIFVLFRLNSQHSFEIDSGKTVKAPLWTIIYRKSFMLIAVSEKGIPMLIVLTTGRSGVSERLWT